MKPDEDDELGLNLLFASPYGSWDRLSWINRGGWINIST